MGGELAAAVIAAERGCCSAGIDQSEPEALSRDLFEHHVPKLAATGVIEYDSMLDRLRLGRLAVSHSDYCDCVPGRPHAVLRSIP